MVTSPGSPGDPESGLPKNCSHPWLRVVCGECGLAVDELRQDRGPSLEEPDRVVRRADTLEPGGPKKLFIVARGHPELVEQLKAVLGENQSVQVIEDRRRVSRDPAAPPVDRNELRRRLLDDAVTPDD